MATMVCHVVATDLGLNMEHETVEHMCYDDGACTLLVVKGGVVFAYDVSLAAVPGSPEQLKWTYALQEGPPVVRMRLSLDGALLAIQRSATLLECAEVATGNIFVHGSERGRAEIMSYFFTEMYDSDLVLVTPGGLELHGFVPKRQGLRFKERIRLPVHWAVYTHETRMVLLGTGTAGASYIKGFQFVSAGIVVLPPFTAGVAGSAAALDAMSGAPMAATPAMATAAAVQPTSDVQADNIRLVKVYGRVYCAHINCRTSKLELYRFYTDTVILQHTYELFSSKVDVCVVDNVLVVQHLDSAVAVLFDVAARTQQPVANPLPLGISSRAPSGGMDANGNGNGGAGTSSGISPAHPSGGSGGSSSGMLRSSSASAMQQWSYRPPGLAFDMQRQVAYRLSLDLKAVTDSCSDPAILVGFLQRRRAPLAGGAPDASSTAAAGSGGGGAQPKTLIMSVVRNALQERLPLPTLRVMFEDLSNGYAQALSRQAAAGPAAGTAAAPGSAGAAGAAIPVPQLVSADELAEQLFRWLHDEEVVDAPYLQAALSEYQSAAVAAGIQLPAYLQKLSLEILLQQSQLGLVPQYLYSQGPHVALEVAEGLMEQHTAHRAGGGGGLASSGGQCISAQLALDVVARSVAVGPAAAAAPLAPAPGTGGLGLAVAAAAALAGGSFGADPIAAAPAGATADAAVVGRYAEELIARGAVLRAAKLLRRYKVAKPTIKELLTAAGKAGDLAQFAAVYRLFKEELLPSYPKFESARAKLLLAGQ